jgi:hypothetical protein
MAVVGDPTRESRGVFGPRIPPANASPMAASLVRRRVGDHSHPTAFAAKRRAAACRRAGNYGTATLARNIPAFAAGPLLFPGTLSSSGPTTSHARQILNSVETTYSCFSSEARLPGPSFLDAAGWLWSEARQGNPEACSVRASRLQMRRRWPPRSFVVGSETRPTWRRSCAACIGAA